MKKERKAPKKSLEQNIAELFASALSQEEFYADDNFFEMGGTSLSASKVIMQLKAKGIEVEYQNIFDKYYIAHLRKGRMVERYC